MPLQSYLIGRRAERLVADTLASRGLIILAANVRVGRDEIDLVALDGAVLVIVEVRARGPGSLGHPFETVSKSKAARLRRASRRYMAMHQMHEVRIDVAAVVGDTVEIIENAVDFTFT